MQAAAPASLTPPAPPVASAAVLASTPYDYSPKQMSPLAAPPTLPSATPALQPFDPTHFWVSATAAARRHRQSTTPLYEARAARVAAVRSDAGAAAAACPAPSAATTDGVASASAAATNAASPPASASASACSSSVMALAATLAAPRRM